jgi:hypothetical protein
MLCSFNAIWEVRSKCHPTSWVSQAAIFSCVTLCSFIHTFTGLRAFQLYIVHVHNMVTPHTPHRTRFGSNQYTEANLGRRRFNFQLSDLGSLKQNVKCATPWVEEDWMDVPQKICWLWSIKWKYTFYFSCWWHALNVVWWDKVIFSRVHSLWRRIACGKEFTLVQPLIL